MIVQIWLNTMPIFVSLIDSKCWINMINRIPSGVMVATIECWIVLARLTLRCIVSFDKDVENSTPVNALTSKLEFNVGCTKTQSLLSNILQLRSKTIAKNWKRELSRSQGYYARSCLSICITKRHNSLVLKVKKWIQRSDCIQIISRPAQWIQTDVFW